MYIPAAKNWDSNSGYHPWKQPNLQKEKRSEQKDMKEWFEKLYEDLATLNYIHTLYWLWLQW